MKRKKKTDAFVVVVTVICGLLALITIYPMWYVLVMSLSDPAEAVKGNVYFWPSGFYLGAYKTILGDKMLLTSTMMSVLYVISGTVFMLITSVMGAYPMTRPNLKFRKLVVWYLLIPMYFSGGMIPTFLLVNNIGIYNTVWAMVLPGAYSISNIILVRTYFMSIPHEMSESAAIDGANNWRIMRCIYLPLSKPVLAVISIYTIVGIWNSWFNAMVYLPNYELHPLQMYLQRVLVAQSVDITKVTEIADVEEIAVVYKRAQSAKQLKYAMIMIVTLPIIMVYPMFQKHFVKGVMLGSLKG